MNSTMILRSPSLAQGGPVHVVRLYERAAHANGGLARAAPRREVHLHISEPEAARLGKHWGVPHMAAGGSMELGFDPGSLMALVDQRQTPVPEGSRTRSLSPIDYAHYGQGPEYGFYKQNVTPSPTLPSGPHIPSAPTTGPAIQSAGSEAPQSSPSSASNVRDAGAALAAGSSLANALGYNNAGTQGAATAGNLASGNYLGAAKSGLQLYDKLGGDVSTQDANAALGRAGDVMGIYSGIQRGGAAGYAQAVNSGAELVTGAGIPALGYAGAVDQAVHGDVPGAAVSAISTAVPLAGLGFAAAGLINKSLNAGGDEKRNMAAFQQAFPGTKLVTIPLGRTQAAFGMLPDGQLVSAKNYQKLAGAWYGANAAPDGNQAKWQKEYQDLLTEIHNEEVSMPKGYTWDPQQQKVSKNFDEGGLAAAMGRHVRGPGTGRSDSIPAQLSDGEYVLTAEDVSLLGDGSNEAGAKRLDEFRAQLRKHKGGALARGKISPNAKTPMQYLCEAAR